MTTFSVKIEEETIASGKVSNRTRLGKAVNRFRYAIERLIALDENIYGIENKELENKREIKEKTKKVIKNFIIKKKEELDNRLLFLKATCECFGGYKEKETILKGKYIKPAKEFKKNPKEDKKIE